jgi:hypothetical protein
MSSDRIGAVGKAATAAEDRDAAAAANPGSADRLAADQSQLADPWFAPGVKDDPAADGALADAAPADAAADEAAHAKDGTAHTAQQAEWFLPTGRAGLLPDSMTVAWDDDEAHSGQAARVQAAGAPPWAAETADALASAPPPWETGPWPGPPGLRPPGVADGEVQADGVVGAGAGNGTRSAVDGAPARGGVGPEAGVGGASMAVQGRWSPRTVLTAGLVPLVVPGLVVGVLSLRQSARPADRRASWLAIVASITWAVIIVLIIAGTSGGSATSCGSFPATVHQAYEKALTDLADHASASVQAADLGTAANRANASAAAAGQIGVRTALFAMANDMAQARADVVAQRPVPSTLRQHLIKDGAAPAGSCPA